MSSRSTPKAGSSRGFTLVETTIAMAILIIILVVSMSLLFSMRNFAGRQQSFVEPRQTARRALDYLSYYVRGASDLNAFGGVLAPNALIMQYTMNGVVRQASYNNITGGLAGTLADAGTDVITLSLPSGSALIPITRWNPPASDPRAANQYIGFSSGCMDDEENMRQFMAITGCYPAASCTGEFPCPGCTSQVLTIVDSQGVWGYYQITGYNQCVCTDANAEYIHVTATHGGSDINPPGGAMTPYSKPVNIVGGLNYFAFRVSTDPATGIPRLQQKNGILNLDLANQSNPTPDNSPTAASFTTLLENVEDFQIAYIFNNGEIWNSGTADDPTARTLGVGQVTNAFGVPDQAGGSAPQTYDVTNVMGLRLTLTARSFRPIPLYQRVRTSMPNYRRPRAEDHAGAGTPAGDIYYHHRITSTIMIRNRMLGS